MHIDMTLSPRGRLTAVFRCDWCEQPIDEPGDGTCLYAGPLSATPHELFVVHARCDQAFEQSRSERLWWPPLSHLPKLLADALKGRRGCPHVPRVSR